MSFLKVFGLGREQNPATLGRRLWQAPPSPAVDRSEEERLDFGREERRDSRVTSCQASSLPVVEPEEHSLPQKEVFLNPEAGDQE